jgi:hypothetical protein
LWISYKIQMNDNQAENFKGLKNEACLTRIWILKLFMDNTSWRFW